MSCKVIAVVNQKGGAGKTVVSCALASFLHQEKKINVAVADLDHQKSFSILRRLDELKRKQGVKNYEDDKFYDVFDNVTSTTFLDVYKIEKDLRDVIIVDLPGSMKQPGVLGCYGLLDIAFVPIKLDTVTISSTKDFVKQLKENINPIREKYGLEPVKIYGFVNNTRMDIREIKERYKKLSSTFSEIEIFDEIMPQSEKTFSGVQSTLNYNMDSRKNEEIKNVLEKMYQKIKQ